MKVSVAAREMIQCCSALCRVAAVLLEDEELARIECDPIKRLRVTRNVFVKLF